MKRGNAEIARFVFPIYSSDSGAKLTTRQLVARTLNSGENASFRKVSRSAREPEEAQIIRDARV